MNFASFKAWISQPTTITALGSAAATIAGLVTHALTHDITDTAAATGAAYALVHAIMPDNSAAPSSVEKLVTDGINAVVQKRVAQMLPTLLADGMAVVGSLQKPVVATETVTVTATPAAPVVVTPAATPATPAV